MKIDSLTHAYKNLKEGTLSVYIETDNTKKYNITTKDHYITIHKFDTREKAVEFCRLLGINIIAFIRHKL